MRRLAFGLGLLCLSGCAQQPPNHSFPLFFTPFSALIDDPATAIVGQAASSAKRVPHAAVHVTGYADPAGTPDGNVQLSKARVDAVIALLIKDGVPAGAISGTAAGTPPNNQPGVVDRRAEIDIDAP